MLQHIFRGTQADMFNFKGINYWVRCQPGTFEENKEVLFTLRTFITPIEKTKSSSIPLFNGDWSKAVPVMYDNGSYRCLRNTKKAGE